MIRALASLGLFATLASCPHAPALVDVAEGAPDLETAAIARGLVRDPADAELVGLYARDTDRVCVVNSGGGYHIGAYVDYGEGVGCNASGTVTRSASILRMKLGDGRCSFDARFDGDRIIFPGRLPDSCADLCSPRASLSALEVSRLSESASEAAAMRDARGRMPCN